MRAFPTDSLWLSIMHPGASGSSRVEPLEACARGVMSPAPIGPVPAIRLLFAKTGLSLMDIDLFEINEAFAAQAVHLQFDLRLRDEKLNVNGGAIALGPAGVHGAKLVATIIRVSRAARGKARCGLDVSAGGMGAAGVIELP